MLADSDITALLLTLKLAAVSTTLLLLVSTPLAWWLSRTQTKMKFVVNTVIALPLVLPPTVLGFYLLILLGSNGPLFTYFDLSLAFTFTGLVVGSMVYSMPFVVQPLQDAFASLGRKPLEAAATLGASPIDQFFTLAIPMAKRGFITAFVLGFAHTLGEFGVVLMIGGSIPGETQVVSIAIYDHVESLDYSHAHRLAGTLLVISIFLLLIVYRSSDRHAKVTP